MVAGGGGGHVCGGGGGRFADGDGAACGGVDVAVQGGDGEVSGWAGGLLGGGDDVEHQQVRCAAGADVGAVGYCAGDGAGVRYGDGTGFVGFVDVRGVRAAPG